VVTDKQLEFLIQESLLSSYRSSPLPPFKNMNTISPQGNLEMTTAASRVAANEEPDFSSNALELIVGSNEHSTTRPFQDYLALFYSQMLALLFSILQGR
jgi:hypothetical protein